MQPPGRCPPGWYCAGWVRHLVPLSTGCSFSFALLGTPAPTGQPPDTAAIRTPKLPQMIALQAHRKSGAPVFPYLIGHDFDLVPQLNMEPHFSDAQLAWLSGLFEPRQYLHIRWTELILINLISCNPPDVVVLQLLGHSFLNCGME